MNDPLLARSGDRLSRSLKAGAPAVLVSAALGALVWALSRPLTGHAEPWDADWPYLVLGLAAAGAISGALVPKPLWAHYVGALAGQLAYELAFLPLGPLFVVGLAFLAGYSAIAFVAAAGVASLRRKANV